MSNPLAIDLFCGLGGWTEGFLAEGFEVIGFDIEQHIYGEHKYPAQLVLQDVRTLHGSQFKDADIIVASSPCQEYSYMAMPWKRAKQIATALKEGGEFPRGYTGSRTVAELNELFNQPERIQAEACDAAGRYIPMIQENVRGAQPWVGKAAHHYGSYCLWGDIPALMPVTHKGVKVPGMNWSGSDKPGYKAVAFNDSRHHDEGRKLPKEVNASIRAGKSPARWTNPDEHYLGRKNGGDWFGSGTDCPLQRKASSGSNARKAASAKIAKIPFPLANYIARVTLENRRAA